uniref:WAT1-related protein n=1 Tax=Anthurium amnicola TaxID=1678845 RepID=A0A1D1YKU5_9ARAE
MSLFYYGLRDTTAAYSSIFLNLIPVVTFIFSVCLRFERLGLGSVPGVAKVIGTLVCVGGAMIISLYKGKVLHIWPFHIDITHNYGIKAPTSNLPRGTTFLVGSTISYACWFILQVKLLKAFPSIYWSTAYSCAVGCVQSLIIGLSLNRERSAWLVVTRLQLVTIIYSALLNTAATFVLVAWAVSKRGPTFPPIFSSISLIFITIVESLIMGLQITVGSLLGMFLITVGIYGFLWGKAKEIAGRNRSPPRSVGAGDVAIVSRLAQTQSSVIPDPASSPAIENTDEPPV